MVEVRGHGTHGQASGRARRTSVSPVPGRSVLVSAPDDGLVLVVNPADDEAFAGWVRTSAAAADTDPADLQARLRVRYPAAVVRRRDLAGERSEVWYVYRDGRWIARSILIESFPGPRHPSGPEGGVSAS